MRAVIAMLMVAVALVATAPPASAELFNYQDGTLVDGDNNFECADNPDGNHHEKRQR